MNIPQTVRRSGIVTVNLALMAIANYLALSLRFDGSIPAPEMAMWGQLLPWLLAIRALVFARFRLHGGLWRYTGIWDLKNILVAVGVSTVCFYALVRWVFGVVAYPRSVFIIDAILLVFLVGGLRLFMRFPNSRLPQKTHKRVLIFGAGDAGEMIVRDMKRYPGREAVGFVDDNLTKVGHRIHGVPVLGTRRDLKEIIEKYAPHEVLIAIPRAEAADLRGFVRSLQSYKIPITTLPNTRELLSGAVAVSQIRSLSIEDLLSRAPVGLEMTPVRELIAGRRVLVTGAGGSIGSELCRQIAAFGPAVLVLYERYENGLYAVANDLVSRSAQVSIAQVIGDVTDEHRLNAVMAEHRPQIVFHAAAHKHVPLMEANVCEAVKNNVIGTRMVAEAAERFGAEHFVLISTDKAVNPSSVMGCTKRVAELLLQGLGQRSATRFVTVRFGNVLGSNGSVVPLFASQISAGGPVTVTHPEIRRYFMMIPEAVLLVLHAAALGKGGELFVLDMGEQLKVLDLAKNLITLSGFVPDQDILIEFIGLRPGEKLYEELSAVDELLEPSTVEKVLSVRGRTAIVAPLLSYQVWELEQAATRGDETAVIHLLAEIVPTFEPGGDAPGLEVAQGRRKRRRRPIYVKRRLADREGLEYVQIVGDRRNEALCDRRAQPRGGRRANDHNDAAARTASEGRRHPRPSLASRPALDPTPGPRGA